MQSRIEKQRYFEGFSLVELLMAISIFMIVITSVAVFSIDTFNYNRNDRLKLNASLQLQEISNAILVNKFDLWETIVQNSDGSTKSIEYINSKYVIVDGTTEINGITVSLTIGDVERDINGNLVKNGGTYDPYTKIITIISGWTDSLGIYQELTSEIYVNNWNVKKWTETTKAEFEMGTTIDSLVRDIPVGDGEVELGRVLFPDWCNPTLLLYEYDIPGSSTATTVFATPGHAYLGTGGNDTGISLSEVNVTGVDPPAITVVEEYDNYLVNNIFVEGDYAYLATTDDSKEVVILDITTSPYTEVGYFNGSGSTDAYSVYVSDNIGYVAQGRNVISFDLSSKAGQRPQLDTVSMVWWFGTVSQIVVRGDYLYASLHNDWYELGIVDISNPSNISVISQTSVNNQQTYDISVSEDGNRTYFGTNSSSSEDEFFILDTSVKTGARPIIGSYDSAGMTIRGLAIIEDDHSGIIVGTSGEEYQVLNLVDETNPKHCGGMQVDNGINDIDSVRDVDGNVFSYVMTRDNSTEFKIVRGGPGGGGNGGIGYIEYAEFESAIFDSESETAKYFLLEWAESLIVNTDIRLQIRTGSTTDLSSAQWYGTGGLNTYFTESGQSIPSDVNGNRYFQYRVILETTNPAVTPSFEEITLYYEL
jgi:type II secretory pathway pseudopilin PulG